MLQKFVDISIYPENEVVSDPPLMRATITCQAYVETVEEAQKFFPGVEADNASGGEEFSENVLPICWNAPWGGSN